MEEDPEVVSELDKMLHKTILYQSDGNVLNDSYRKTLRQFTNTINGILEDNERNILDRYNHF